VTYFEDDPDHPVFRRIVSPTRKFTGDNADTVYYDAPVSPARTYRVRGNTAGAIYFSLTVEAGAKDGRFGTRTTGPSTTPNSTSAPTALRGHRRWPAQPKNWLALPDDAARVTTRHYYEDVQPRAADTTPCIPLHIEVVGDVGPPPTYSDASVAAASVASSTSSRRAPLAWASPARASNRRSSRRFRISSRAGQARRLRARRARRCLLDAMYMVGPDDALVIRAAGRSALCQCLAVEPHMQTFDYAHRQVSLNRKQTKLDSDGSFRMVIAHRDPGVPNWLDTEGRGSAWCFGASCCPRARSRRRTPRSCRGRACGRLAIRGGRAGRNRGALIWSIHGRQQAQNRCRSVGVSRCGRRAWRVRCVLSEADSS